MHKDISFVLEIPFESRKAFDKKSSSKYSYKGNAYYLINSKGYILRDFMVLNNEKVEYRPNDNKMMIGSSGNGTDFWKSKGQERKKIFPNSPFNYLVETATTEIIEKLNHYSISKTSTVLSLEGMISGSNTSGADLKMNATPIFCSGNTYYGMRFVNAFKALRIKKNNSKACNKYKITQTELSIVQKLSLNEYLEHFKFAKKEFYRYNPESYNLLYKDGDNDITQNLYFINFKTKALKGEMNAYKDKATLIIEKYNDNIIKRELVINRLRGFLRSMLLIEKQQKGKDPVIGRSEKDSNLDAAHLYDVRWIKNTADDELWRIADPNNGLLLPKDIHWKFDKDKEFNINSNFEFVNNNKKTNIKIDPVYINEKRKEYIEKRNERILK